MLTLDRLDYLNQVRMIIDIVPGMVTLTSMQRKYVDAVNGKSGLTYFEALESEV
jgi:hypothetical protein